MNFDKLNIVIIEDKTKFLYRLQILVMYEGKYSGIFVDNSFPIFTLVSKLIID